MLKRSRKTFADDVDIIAQEDVYQGHFTFEKHTLRFKTFAGPWSRVVQREVIRGYDVVCGLLFDPKLDSVVMLEQMRIGALHSALGPWSIEIVAGIVEHDEDHARALARETHEETGLTLQTTWPLYSYWPAPGASAERVHLYLVKVDASHAGGTHGAEEEGEDILLHHIPVTAAFEAVAQGEIDNAPSIMALNWLQYHYDQVKTAWGHAPAHAK